MNFALYQHWYTWIRMSDYSCIFLYIHVCIENTIKPVKNFLKNLSHCSFLRGFLKIFFHNITMVRLEYCSSPFENTVKIRNVYYIKKLKYLCPNIVKIDCRNRNFSWKTFTIKGCSKISVNVLFRRQNLKWLT